MDSFYDEGNQYLSKPQQLGSEFELKPMSPAGQTFIDLNAQGSWARVVGVRRVNSGKIDDLMNDMFACKVMRAHFASNEKVHEMFRAEVKALREFEANGFTPRMIKCGYLRPPETGQNQIEFIITPELWSMDLAFRNLIHKPGTTQPWLPFIIMEYIGFEHTLLYKAKSLTNYEDNDSQTEIMPIWEFLDVAEQALQHMVTCHERGFYYVDHKLEHTILQQGRVRFIDWNVCTWLNENAQQQSSARILANSDFRNLTAIVLYPLLTGESIQGDHPVVRHNGNVNVSFEDDNLTILRRGVLKHLLDQRLLQILGKALVRDPDQSYANASEYLAELREYRQIMESEWAPAFHRMQDVVIKLREVQDEIDKIYKTLMMMSRSDRGAKIDARLYAELKRLQRGVVNLKKNSKIVTPKS